MCVIATLFVVCFPLRTIFTCVHHFVCGKMKWGSILENSCMATQKNIVCIYVKLNFWLLNSQVYSPRNMITYVQEFKSLMEWGHNSCKKLLDSEHIDVLLNRDQKFEVLITEFFNTDCALGLAYKLNISSFIGMSSCALMPGYVCNFAIVKWKVQV